jgi:hypothetical protein
MLSEFAVNARNSNRRREFFAFTFFLPISTNASTKTGQPTPRRYEAKGPSQNLQTFCKDQLSNPATRVDRSRNPRADAIKPPGETGRSGIAELKQT